MPGVPPNAGSLVKKVFKGLFKRSKKGEDADGQDQPDSQLYAQPPSSSRVDTDTSASRLSPTPPSVDTSRYSRISDKPPRLDDPISTGSPLTVEPSGKLPDTEPSSALSANATAPTQEVDKLKEQDAKRDDVSALGAASTSDQVNSAPVSALEDSQSMSPPSKIGSTGDEKPVDDARQVEQTTHEESSPSQEQQATQPPTNVDDSASPEPDSAAPPAVPPKDNVAKTNGMSQPLKPQNSATNGSPTSHPNMQSESKPATSADATSASDLEQSSPKENKSKTPHLGEMPEIKQVQAAPGMSATSGPLEDYFPEASDSGQQER